MSDEIKECPFCGEEIKAIAKKCRFCGEMLVEKAGKPDTLPLKDKISFAGRQIVNRMTQWIDKISSGDEAKKKKIKWAFGGGAVIILLVLIIALCSIETVEHVDLPPGRPDHQLLEYTEKGDLRAVKFLIVKREAKVNGAVYKHSGETALHIALRNQFNDIAEYLIKKDADVNAKDDAQRTPLFYPLQNKDYGMMEILLDNEAEKIIEAVFYAVDINDEKLLDFLLKNDFPVNVVDNNGDTPLHTAARKNLSPVIVELLLKNKARTDSVNNSGYTPLLLALECNSSPAIVKLLIDGGSDVNMAAPDGNRPLHLAVNEFPEGRFRSRINSPEYTRLLLAANADVNAKNKLGKTALQLAGNSNVINQLLQSEALVIRDDNDSRIFDLLIFKSNGVFADAKRVEALVKAGANPMFFSRRHLCSALNIAARNGNKAAASVIIKYSDFGVDQPMHDEGAARYMVDMPELVKAMIDKGKHLNDDEIYALPLDLVKYYLQKNIGGGLNSDEHFALERKIAVQYNLERGSWQLREFFTENGWNELMANAVKDPESARYYRDIVKREHRKKQQNSPEAKNIVKRKTVVAGSILLPCEGESLEEYDKRFNIINAQYEENGSCILNYFANGVKAMVIKHRKFQIDHGMEPDGIEVKDKNGNIEIYAERVKNTP